MDRLADREVTRARVRRIVCEVVGCGPEVDVDNVRALGIDSFKVVELTLALEDEFAIAIPDDKLLWSSLETIDRIAALVEGSASADASYLAR